MRIKNKCIVCDVEVASYAPDHKVREQALLKFGQDSLNLPYPGKPAVFVFKDGGWNRIYESGGDLCRQVSLVSQTPDALIKKIQLCGYRGGEVILAIEFDHSSVAEQYFIAHELFPNKPLQFMIYAKTLEQLGKLFKIIIENNRFPEDQLALWKSVIEKGTTDILPTHRREIFWN